MMKKIILAADHAGFHFKQHLIGYLKINHIETADLGCYDLQSVDYPDYAHKLCKHLQHDVGGTTGGVLICGTGIGMSMAANRHTGIRAAVCNTGPQSAFYARAHNDANILCLGERLINIEQAVLTLKTFIDTPFEQGRHAQRVAKIDSNCISHQQR